MKTWRFYRLPDGHITMSRNFHRHWACHFGLEPDATVTATTYRQAFWKAVHEEGLDVTPADEYVGATMRQRLWSTRELVAQMLRAYAEGQRDYREQAQRTPKAAVRALLAPIAEDVDDRQ